MYPTDTEPKVAITPYEQLTQKFVADVRSQLETLNGEIALRNKTINYNDSYVYGDLLRKSLNVPLGHDFTPVNWLRRTCEIHRTQTMGDGFNISSSYHGIDVDSAFDPDAKPQLIQLNNKMKDNAEARNKLFAAIMRDNGGQALFARAVEGASAVGFSIIKTYYDQKRGKYCLDLLESVEYFYSLWNNNDFRRSDLDAFVFQISKQQAVKDYQVPPTVATSPLGMPLTQLTAANVIEYISTQPMVTVMEINGLVQGYTSNKGIISTCAVGEETKINAFIVGDRVKKLEDNPKYMPHYYNLPNKQIRRRPWGMPDITPGAISINQTYIETLSDWRTVQSKVNFPKYKAFGFGMDVQLPTPKERTVEMIGLGEGQDIQPIQNPNSASNAQTEFIQTLQELKEAFVREVGISANLFDMPDAASSNSNQAMMTAMKSISDQVEARRQLWNPIIERIFLDALDVLALWDENIKSLVQDNDDWYIRVSWPPAMRKDDPTFQTMVLNRIVSGTMSVQTFLERMGENAKEEIDRMSDEMENPITAAIHGKLLSLLAEFKIAGPPSQAPPKTSISLSGVLTPEQESNLASMHQFGNGPNFGPTAGPQGEQGVRANTDLVDQGLVTGTTYPTGTPLNFGPTPTAPANGPSPVGGGAAPSVNTPTQPQPIAPPGNNQPGQQPMSQPQSGQPATPNSPAGNVNQSNQRAGRK